MSLRDGDIERLEIGDPVPWFDAHTLAGASISLGVVAGRWVVLGFFNALAHPDSGRTLAELLGEAKLFDDDHLVFYGIVTEPPAEAVQLAQVSHPALGFIVDRTGDITRQYGALGASRVMVLDPMLRLYGDFPIGPNGPPVEEIRRFLRNLPKVDDAAGVPLSAPALIVPRVLEKSFCDELIGKYEDDGGVESGFMLDQGGKTATVVNHFLKSRRDLALTDPEVREKIRARVVRRLVPAIERFFQCKPTRMDRYMVSCYAADSGGHFSRHRDNINAGARHRRFAVSINLNHDYDGCDLFFPEFGRRLYRAPHGGAIVFSTGALHQVTPITRGKRYAFVPFLYGEEESRQRMANNALLQTGEGHYTGEHDRLFLEDVVEDTVLSMIR
jgi:predicted 2-oxoglutarate/Fe(II)-dependent dioxygenase YbiX/peroxiredoxin